MSEAPRDLESMSCEELLTELARLTTERDHAESQGASPAQAGEEHDPQVAGVLRQSERIDRIGDLLKAKGCQGVLSSEC